MKEEAQVVAEVRAVLQLFQDGYTARDVRQLDGFMNLFTDSEDLEVIGTGATTIGQGEWCIGREAVRNLIESDWKYWGDLTLDVAGAHIQVHGDVAWLATDGRVREQIEREPAYQSYLKYVEEILADDTHPELKLLEMVRTGTNAVYQLTQSERFVWPLRFTAVLLREAGTWRFSQMQFCFPTTRYPDVRLAE